MLEGPHIVGLEQLDFLIVGGGKHVLFQLLVAVASLLIVGGCRRVLFQHFAECRQRVGVALHAEIKLGNQP